MTKNILYTFILNKGRMKGHFLHASELVNKIKETHSLGLLETLVLGHAFIGTALMSGALKNTESIKLKLECSGPVKGLSVEAFSTGAVRGYLFQNPMESVPDIESFDTSPLIQAGFITVTRFFENEKNYSGQVMVEHGRLAEDLANYYLISEQIKTAFNLSIYFDREGSPAGAGGLFLQVMPDADEIDIGEAETAVAEIPSIGKYFSESTDSIGFLLKSFGRCGIEIIGSKNIEFKCGCSRERFYSFISSMNRKEISSILKEGPLPLKTICHNCSTEYLFKREELENILNS